MNRFNVGCLPLEIITEIIMYLPGNFIVSDRMLPILERVFGVSSMMLVSDSESVIGHRRCSLHNDDSSDDRATYVLDIKNFVKRNFIEQDYISILFSIFKSISIGKYDLQFYVYELLNSENEFDINFMVRVLRDKLQIQKLYQIGADYNVALRDAESRFEGLDWNWEELQLLYKFTDRNSYCLLCNPSSQQQGVNEKYIAMKLNEIGGEMNFEWLCYNDESCRPRYIESQIPGILKLQHVNHNMPFKVRGCIKLRDGRIVFENLWVKRPELCLEERIIIVPESYGIYFRNYFYKRESFTQRNSTIQEIISQLYWFPNLSKPKHIIRVRTDNGIAISDVETEIIEPSIISKFCNGNLFKSRESISKVEIEINVFKKEKHCTIIPKSIIMTAFPVAMLSLISLILSHFSCFLNFSFSRQYYNRHSISWSEIAFFVGCDIFSGTLIGYLTKGYYCFKWGYPFWESHVTLIETLGNLYLISGITKTLSQVVNSHYRRKSKHLPLYNE